MTVRPAADDDLPGILALAEVGLGWEADRRHEALFRWKHVDNPFGCSPLWVAVDAGRVVALRAFLRWEFVRAGEVVRAVRAVDTVTHPDYRGRGLFRRLTLEALDALRDDGVAFVFNTPNDQSRPGYLSMGWRVVGRLPMSVRVRSVARMARVPAATWSEPTGGTAVVVDVAPVRSGRLTTRRTAEYLAWRYGMPDLHYASVQVGDATAYYRVRRRGQATEAAVCDVVGQPATKAMVTAARAAGADYAVCLGRRRGFVPVPGQGPVLTWRGLCDERPPSRRHFDLSLGDIELF
jgi:GNAT superfamily N-acetyltransferase